MVSSFILYPLISPTCNLALAATFDNFKDRLTSYDFFQQGLGFSEVLPRLKYENHSFLCSPINPAFIAVRIQPGPGMAVQQ